MRWAALAAALAVGGCTLFELDAPVNVNAQLCAEGSTAVICCPEALLLDIDAILYSEQLVLTCGPDPGHDDDGYAPAPGGGDLAVP